MMNVRLKLREPKSLTTPHGPTFRLARTIRTAIAGTDVSFKVPRHRPRNSNNEAVFPARDYPLERLHLHSNFDEQDADLGRKHIFEMKKIFHHSWAFYGSWFAGILSELRFTIRLCRPINHLQEFSLFHPRALETVIAEYLEYRYAHHLDETKSGVQEFMAPVNWTPLPNLPVNAVQLEVKQQDYFRGRRRIDFVFLPVAADLMLVMHFEASCLRSLPKEEVDKLINPQPMYDMVDKIVNSIQLKLSPEAQAQQAKAWEGLADTSLVKEFPPLKWDKLDEQQTQAILLGARSH